MGIKNLFKKEEKRSFVSVISGTVRKNSNYEVLDSLYNFAPFINGLGLYQQIAQLPLLFILYKYIGN